MEIRKPGVGKSTQGRAGKAGGKGLTDACRQAVGILPRIGIGRKFAGMCRWRATAWHLFRSLPERRYHR
jgi:hypothetical protein